MNNSKHLEPSNSSKAVDDTDDKNDFYPVDDSDNQPDIQCDICHAVFTCVSSYDVHINGRKHLKKVQALRRKKDENPMGGQPNESSATTDPDAIFCDLCQLSFTGYMPYKQHINSSKHVKQLNKVKLDEDLKGTPEVLSKLKISKRCESNLPEPYGNCPMCSKTFYSPESLTQHMAGSGHSKKVSQSKLKEVMLSSAETQGDARVVFNKDDQTAGAFGSAKYFAECQTCTKKFSGPESFQMHMICNTHLRKVELQKLEEEMKAKGVDVITDGKYLCKECGKTFGDFLSLTQHKENNVHEKKNVKKEVADFLENYPEITVLPHTEEELAAKSDESSEVPPDFYVCVFCKCSFSGPECAKQHVMGRKHKRVKDIMNRLQNSPKPVAGVEPNASKKNVGKSDQSVLNRGLVQSDNSEDFEVIG